MIKRSIDHIKKLGPAERKSLAEILSGGKKADGGFIAQMLTTPIGLFRVLKSLSDEEYCVFAEIAKDPSGSSMGQLEIALKLKRDAIDAIADSLEKKLLAFVIKNRQHLHNKSDRLIPYEDIRAAYQPVESSQIQDAYRKLLETVRRMPRKRQLPKENNHLVKSFLELLVRNGGVASLNEIMAKIENKSLPASLNELLRKKIITIAHTPQPPFDALVFLAPEALESVEWENLPEKTTQNRYNLLLNILLIYDIVSTFGLFLTQQGNFRKVDLDRILHSLLPLENISGKKVSTSQIFPLCLHLMHRGKLAEIDGDSVHASLMPAGHYLNQPDAMLFSLIAGDEAASEHPLLAAPFPVPRLENIRKMLKILISYESAVPQTALFAAVADSMQTCRDEHITNIPETAKVRMQDFEHTMHFLHLIGATIAAHGKISLSDIGIALARQLKLASETNPTGESRKLVYINPDYSVLIPREGLSSREYYMLLSRMEILKDDVVIHAKITHRSILNAYKRGMQIEEFMEVLEALSKTPLPQNLSFMLKEWTRQAIEVHIYQAILIKVNHPSFLDEIQAGKLQKAIIERLSPTVAVIRKDQIDEVVKHARRKDAVIRLFEE